MKNLFTIIAFAATMLFGVQNISAQSLSVDKNRPEVIAKAETAELTETLGLNGEQSRTIFRALVAKEINYQKHIEGKDATDAKVIANKKKFDSSLDGIMKKTLTEEQYAKWNKTQ
ncbi:hypothetical protein [Aequorivita sediminis]|uniref:hypothetical protein n=1 Tax=Aequorivita sediminis TaxID=3073653 RepID=UPI0028ADB71B|nr:hypothetical protein [Aequorivita sp. F6058]